MKYINSVHKILLQRLGITPLMPRDFLPVCLTSQSATDSLPKQFAADVSLYLSDPSLQLAKQAQLVDSIFQQFDLSPQLNYLDSKNKRLLWQKLQTLDTEHVQ